MWEPKHVPPAFVVVRARPIRARPIRARRTLLPGKVLPRKDNPKQTPGIGAQEDGRNICIGREHRGLSVVFSAKLRCPYAHFSDSVHPIGATFATRPDEKGDSRPLATSPIQQAKPTNYRLLFDTAKMQRALKTEAAGFIPSTSFPHITTR